jgi:hypothetical protein
LNVCNFLQFVLLLQGIKQVNCCCRIDPKSACRVEVTVNSYFTMQDGRKEYNRGKTVSYVVDSEEYSVIDLEKDIASEFKWGSDQQPNFWVLTRGNMTSKLASDAQLLDLLRASRVVKLLMIVGNCEHNVGHGHIPATWNIQEEIPVAVNIEEEMLDAMDNNLEEADGGFAWAEIPEYGETTAGPPMAKEEEKEHFITVGCDPNGDEPAGIDEEWRYFKSVDHVAIDPLQNLKVEGQKRKRARPVLEIRDFDTEAVPEDETTLLDVFIVPHTSHDSENPVIKEGDTFVDKIAFVHTIKQYAIKNEFETRIEHSDKERYRARCVDENCDWRVYAKKLHGGNTFMVTIPFFADLLTSIVSILCWIFLLTSLLL